jgi:peptidoglycan/xylan/chitin deacetylase (PgdA/CDA1 family)
MTMSNPRLLVTVDTELSNFPSGQGLWGRVENTEWGVNRLLALFAELQLRATFFLDVYATDSERLANQKLAAEVIQSAGHDVQLHTHPAEAFDPSRDQLRDYNPEEQESILAFGRTRIQQWTGRAPLLHRAGDWAANQHTLPALKRLGFKADFSACPWSRNCALDVGLMKGNGWRIVEGLLCGVGTCYLDYLTGRTRRLDLGGSSLREVLDIIGRRIDPLIITLHSFSLLNYDRARRHLSGATSYVERLRWFCATAVRDYGYRSVSALEAVLELANTAPSDLPWGALPTSAPTASCAGIIHSVRDRLRI